MNNERNYLKYLTAAAAVFVIFLFGGGATYAYNTPVATIQVIINPSIELITNRFDKIIKSTPINADGVTLLHNLQLKNKNIDQALTLVIEEAKKDNFINANYNVQGKIISVNISAKDSSKIIKLDKFRQYIEDNKINTRIDDNGKKINQEFFKIDERINKEVPEDNNLPKINQSNSDKNIKNDTLKPLEGENIKGVKKSNSDKWIKVRPESKGDENKIPNNLPSKTNQDKSADEKEQSSKNGD